MAIYRVGPAKDTVRTPLGGVLVTIDDLDGLISLLSVASTGAPALLEEVRVEFNGGYFTEAADLRRLSDEELKSLRVVSPDKQIILSESEAVVIGSESVGRLIYQDWARARTTRRTVIGGRIRLRPSKRHIVTAILGAMAFILVFDLVGIILGSIEPSKVQINVDTNSGGAWALSLAAISTLALVYLRATRVAPNSFAVIEPVSLAEYRQNRSSDIVPRWNLIVTLLSVAVAIAAIIVSVLVAK